MLKFIEVSCVVMAVGFGMLALLLGYELVFGQESQPLDSTDLQAQREFGRWEQRQIEAKQVATKDDTR